MCPSSKEGTQGELWFMSHWGGARDHSHMGLAALGRDPCKLLQFAWSTFVVVWFLLLPLLLELHSFRSLK